MGLVVGAANFDWSSRGSVILPGAISEHLTSAGGVMEGGPQTRVGNQPWEGEAPAEPNAHGTAAQQELRSPKTALSDSG